MTKSLNIQKPPKKSACEPQTFVCMRAFNNAPCDYYFKIFSQCLYQGFLIPLCLNEQAWPKDQT